MFQQAKKIARNTTNRKPENVIPSILLRLQAKQIMGKLSLAYQASETEVKKVATTVKPCGGTTVSDYFVTHTSSWQSHLDRISRYLVLGEGVWVDKK